KVGKTQNEDSSTKEETSGDSKDKSDNADDTKDDSKENSPEEESPQEDSVKDNFGNSHLGNENTTSCAYNMAQHAISPQYDDNANITKENNCGGILSQEKLINDSAIKMCNLNIKSGCSLLYWSLLLLKI
ncbi:MAG: hypothetical protein R3Y46_06775, partial [Opitutales bacterium]